MNVRRIDSKAQFYRLYSAGVLGNRSHQWFSLADFLSSGFTGEVGIRSLKAGGRCQYYVKSGEVAERLRQFWPSDGYNISPMMPPTLLVGEIGCYPDWFLYYSTNGQQMRDALRAAPQWAEGLKARVILKHYMDPHSWGDLQDLMDLYPDAAIEFGVYNQPVGILPHRNTIIWEVRNY